MESAAPPSNEEEYNPEEATGDSASEDKNMESEPSHDDYSKAGQMDVNTETSLSTVSKAEAATPPERPPSQKEDGDWSNNLGGMGLIFGFTGNSQSDRADVTGDGQPTEGPAAKETKQIRGTEQSSQGPVPPASVGERAKAYVKKKKECAIEELKKSMGSHRLTYEAVRVANIKSLAAPYLQSGEPVIDRNLMSDGDFFSTADGRVLRMHMESNLPRKTNTAYSFNPWRMTCGNCPGAANHSVLGAATGNRDITAGREAILLSDYSYPPVLPSSSSQNCIRIIRLENGNILELTNILLDKLRGRKLCDGSIVMVFSAAHLALVGLHAYTEDMVLARRSLLSSLGPNIYFTAAPPLLLCGSTNSELLKNTFALTGWANSALTEEERLDMSSDTALGVILENGHGGAQLDGSSRMRLPTSITSLGHSKIWSVGSNMKLPNMTAPPSEEQEERVVLALIKELKLNLALDLDEKPCMDRTPGPMADNNGEEIYLLVGSSNARRIAEVMQKQGRQVGVVISNNWRATKKTVEDMTQSIKEELENKRYTAIVFLLLDNSVFFAQGEDGSRSLPRKEKDGTFHVEGDVTIADKDSQFTLLKMCEPIWETAKGINMVLVSPMARYITAGCCENQTHASNRGNPDFYPRMRDELAAFSNNIKNYLFTSGIRHGRVMDPARAVRGLVAAEIWGRDPVHPHEEVYVKIADGIREVERSCGSGKSKRKRTSGESDEPTGGGATQRGQVAGRASYSEVRGGGSHNRARGAWAGDRTSGQQPWRGRGGPRRPWGGRWRW